jgi:HPt (histidine-containing phosphotransfer) domain-containing protein
VKTKDFSGIRSNGPLPRPEELNVPSDIGDLLNDYIESTCSMLNELEEATLAYEAGHNREEHAAVVRRVLHKIKGESSMVGVEDMSELCHQAEYAFEELPVNNRPDMLLRFKDWAWSAIQNLPG